MSHGGPTASTSRVLTCASSTGPAAASPCSTSTTAAAPATAAPTASGSRAVGHRRRRRLRQRRALPRRRRAIVDGERLAITGGSAGGYTTLAALTFRDSFKAGASYYGVSDLEALARDTHKFESRYLDWLIGPYPSARDLYRERSPIHHADRLSLPGDLLPGARGKVVPPNQAEMMVEALRAKGIPVGVRPLRGRAARLPPGREHQARARCRALFLCRAVFFARS